MGFIKRILARLRGDYEDEYFDEEWDDEPYNSQIDYHNKEQRSDYVKSCMEKLADATKELENLNFEYEMVTSYLKDMEEIEALPEEETALLQEYARKVELLQDSRADYMERPRRMSDEQYHKMERVADEIDEAFRKLKETENYQDLIKGDLQRLDGEKHAYLYRKSELIHMIADTRGMEIICVAALSMCFALLLVLQFLLELDTKLGYILIAGVAAIGMTLIFVKHVDAKHELKRVENGINKIILLQNKVKIRYVNNTNLLDYLYLKYGVSSSRELSDQWEAYRLEKEAREKFRRTEIDLDYNQQELLKLLKCYQIQDPAIWLHQTEALLDRKEMVEIRHNLIIRRQSLRKRMDYNKEVVAGQTQKDIKELVEKYPQYAGEVMAMVEEYEKKFN